MREVHIPVPDQAPINGDGSAFSAPRSDFQLAVVGFLRPLEQYLSDSLLLSLGMTHTKKHLFQGGRVICTHPHTRISLYVGICSQNVKRQHSPLPCVVYCFLF